MLKRFILVFLLSGLLSQVAIADELTNAKIRDIKRLMDVTGAANLSIQFASATSQRMSQSLKASRPEIPDHVLAVIDREFMALLSEKMSAPGGMLDQVIPVYDKYFTHQEIQELIVFYQTPVGKKPFL